MKVLLATDGSKNSEEAAWLLSRLPHREPLELAVVTVLSPPIAAFYSPTRQFMDEIVGDDRKFAETQQASICEMFAGANVKVECHILEGRAQDQLVQFAQQMDADLIVIGAKGHSQIDRILLGSTSDYVATHADCSVLVVRPTSLREDPSRRIKVAVAYDSSGASQAAIEELLEFDWRTNTEFTICTVAGYNPVFNPDYGFSPESLLKEAKSSLHTAKEQLEPKVETVQEQIIEHAHVAEGLVQFTEQQQTDLVVLGETGRSSLARALLGSVSRYVLRHAKCGVWITRNRSIEGIEKRASHASDKLAESP